MDLVWLTEYIYGMYEMGKGDLQACNWREEEM